MKSQLSTTSSERLSLNIPSRPSLSSNFIHNINLYLWFIINYLIVSSSRIGAYRVRTVFAFPNTQHIQDTPYIFTGCRNARAHGWREGKKRNSGDIWVWPGQWQMFSYTNNVQKLSWRSIGLGLLSASEMNTWRCTNFNKTWLIACAVRLTDWFFWMVCHLQSITD